MILPLSDDAKRTNGDFFAGQDCIACGAPDALSPHMHGARFDNGTLVRSPRFHSQVFAPHRPGRRELTLPVPGVLAFPSPWSLSSWRGSQRMTDRYVQAGAAARFVDRGV